MVSVADDFIMIMMIVIRITMACLKRWLKRGKNR